MNRRIPVGALLVALGVLALTSFASAKNGIVRTKDGRTIEGDVTDKGNDGVTIKTRIATVTLAKDDVQSITYAENIQEAYEQRLKALPKDATARHHIDIARWLFENREYQLARKELDKALALDPNSAEAATFKQTVARTEALDRGRQPNGDRPPVAPPDRNPGATRPAAHAIRPGDRKLLEPEDINTIRQLELNERADRNRVRVNFAADVKRRFIDYDNRDAREFNAMTPFTQAWDILRNGTQEMRKDVKVVSDPAAIAEFRTAVQPTILQGCATTGCHGGTNAGKFVLYSPADNEAVTYTNFYILTQFAADVDGGRRKALDRLYPGNSLILQFGLPRDRAEFDHPEAAGWAPIYRDSQDPRYRRIADWMKNALAAVEPKYDIEYTLPGGAGAEPRPPENRPPERRAAPAPERRGENNNRNNRDDARDKTDEARDRIRPGRGGVPGIGGIGGI
jgi:hypothetical protein